MKNLSPKYPLLIVVSLLAAAGCGGDTSVNSAANGFNEFDAAGWNNSGSTTGSSGATGSAGYGAGLAAGAGGGTGVGNPNGGGSGLPPGGPNCGNGTLDSGEQCDGKALGGGTCASATMAAMSNGRLGCNSNCTYDVSGCRGNGPGGGSGGGGGGGGAFGSGGGP